MAILYIDMLTAHHQLAGLLGIGEGLAPAKIEATVREAARVFLAGYAADPA